VDDGFDFIVVPLVHPRYERTFVRGAKRPDPLTRSDLLFKQVLCACEVLLS
jgi:hypothetical protein